MRARRDKSLRIFVGLYKQYFRIFDRDRVQYSVAVAEGISLDASAELEQVAT
jgi:hypothetical protein